MRRAPFASATDAATGHAAGDDEAAAGAAARAARSAAAEARDRAASGALQVARFVLSVLAAGAILATFALARRQASLKRPATAVAQLLGVVLAFGFVIRQTGSDDLGVLFSLATVALLWTLTLLGALASLETVPDADQGNVGEPLAADTQESPTGPVS